MLEEGEVANREELTRRVGVSVMSVRSRVTAADAAALERELERELPAVHVLKTAGSGATDAPALCTSPGT